MHSWEMVGIIGKKLYWLNTDSSVSSELDMAIRDAGFSIWPTTLGSALFDLDAPTKEVEWYHVGSFLQTAQVIEKIRGTNRTMASPADYIRALQKRVRVNGKLNLGGRPHICLYKVAGAGQAKTGYGSLIASDGGQSSLIPIECGDGWGEDCVFATVPA